MGLARFADRRVIATSSSVSRMPKSGVSISTRSPTETASRRGGLIVTTSPLIAEIRYARSFGNPINAPTSIVGHDDLEMYERAQEGLEADGLEWVNIQRLRTGEEDYTEEAVENGTTERQMRNQFDAWVRFMTRDMPAREAAE